MAKVGIDLGHGENTWEKTGGKGVKTNLTPEGRMEEHWFNAAVGLYSKEILERHNVEVVMAQKPYQDEVPLRTRTNYYNAQKCDLIVSDHANAGNSKANGFCVFYWYNSKEAKRLAEIILKHSKELPLKQFGTGVIASVPKTWTDFHICREPNMISPLIEWAFMTNKDDLKHLVDEDFRKKCGEIQAKAILEYLKIPYIQPMAAPPPREMCPKWDGVPMNRGQIGRLNILKPINLWKRNEDDKLEFVRILQPNSTFRVYGYDELHGGQYSVGGGYYVTKMEGYVHYQTPSKRTLEQAKVYFKNK